MEFSDSDKSKLATIKTEVEQLYGDSSIESKVNDALIQMRKPDFRPIDRKKAKEVITALFEKRLAQNKDGGNHDPTSVVVGSFFEQY